jgi:hypothetical protein
MLVQDISSYVASKRQIGWIYDSSNWKYIMKTYKVGYKATITSAIIYYI